MNCSLLSLIRLKYIESREVAPFIRFSHKLVGVSVPLKDPRQRWWRCKAESKTHQLASSLAKHPAILYVLYILSLPIYLGSNEFLPNGWLVLKSVYQMIMPLRSERNLLNGDLC